MGAFFVLAANCDDWPDAVPVGFIDCEERIVRLLLDGLRTSFQQESPSPVFSCVQPKSAPEILAFSEQCIAAQQGEFGEHVEAVCRAVQTQRILIEEFEANKARRLANPASGEENSKAGATPPTAKQDEGEGIAGTGAALGQEQSPVTSTREVVLRQLEPAVRKAYFAFQYAETMNGRRLEDREAYDWLYENGIDQGKGDLGELTDYQLPNSLETFRRYLGTARQALAERKYNRRGGREHGGSIVRGNKIEYQKGDET